MGYQHIQVPADGEKITVNKDATLNVPDRPIIPFIEGDGIGVDITPVMKAVVDAAVEKAYGGSRSIAWMEIYSGEKSLEVYGEDQWLPEETLEAMREFIVGIKGPMTTPVGGGIRSLNVALRQELDLYVCQRPVRWFTGVPSPVVHPEKTDMVIFRENTEDIYAGVEWEADSADADKVLGFLQGEMGVTKIRFPQHCGIGIKPISVEGTKRLVRKALQYAVEEDRPSVTFVHKGNIMKFTEGAFKDWGYELANQTNVRKISQIALDGLFEGTHADSGALLMAQKTPITNVGALEVVAWRCDEQPKYQRVSRFLAESVLRTDEAVLARDIQDDSALGMRDSKGEIEAISVICAPIRLNDKPVGLVHLYSTQAKKVLDPDDLEFTLAVAENVALALKNRFREQKLVEDLTKTKSEISQLREQLGVESEIVGNSAAMLEVHQQIARAAPSNATILIRGESGVGKELVARAIHFSSPRKKGPFVCLNCAALSESLLESELFGHERGAFTGATERKMGKFEAANKGTLMLDEIGEMSPSIQAKFLRVLEGHPFERVGGSKAITSDVRVIAATNRDLERAVREGTFRKDLFFRLNVVQLEVPPLRKRPEDVIELAEYFLHKFGADTGRRVTGLSSDAMLKLKTYRWPGNVRELRNVVERAVLLARDELVEADELLLSNLMTSSESQMDFSPVAQNYRPEPLTEVERRHILNTLIATGWNKSKTAQILGIERSTLDRKIRRYELAKHRPAS